MLCVICCFKNICKTGLYFKAHKYFWGEQTMCKTLWDVQIICASCNIWQFQQPETMLLLSRLFNQNLLLLPIVLYYINF